MEFFKFIREYKEMGEPDNKLYVVCPTQSSLMNNIMNPISNQEK
jgi:hypothetical protein